MYYVVVNGIYYVSKNYWTTHRQHATVFHTYEEAEAVAKENPRSEVVPV